MKKFTNTKRAVALTMALLVGVCYMPAFAFAAPGPGGPAGPGHGVLQPGGPNHGGNGPVGPGSAEQPGPVGPGPGGQGGPAEQPNQEQGNDPANQTNPEQGNDPAEQTNPEQGNDPAEQNNPEQTAGNENNEGNDEGTPEEIQNNDNEQVADADGYLDIIREAVRGMKANEGLYHFKKPERKLKNALDWLLETYPEVRHDKGDNGNQYKIKAAELKKILNPKEQEEPVVVVADKTQTIAVNFFILKPGATYDPAGKPEPSENYFGVDTVNIEVVNSNGEKTNFSRYTLTGQKTIEIEDQGKANVATEEILLANGITQNDLDAMVAKAMTNSKAAYARQNAWSENDDITVDWYTVKVESDGLHVDGVLLKTEKETTPPPIEDEPATSDEEPIVEPGGDTPATPSAGPTRRSRTVVAIADEEVPLGDAPEFDIPDGDVPLSDAPEFEIEDEEVPLANLPVTGGMGVGLFLLAGAALAGAGASLRRKDEE